MTKGRHSALSSFVIPHFLPRTPLHTPISSAFIPRRLSISSPAGVVNLLHYARPPRPRSVCMARSAGLKLHDGNGTQIVTVIRADN
jgi:hypothetical protein